MRPTEVDSIRELRKEAASLLNNVFEEKISPRYAINRWPGQEETWDDPSLKVAFQALWHFEADEKQQQSMPFYMDVQLELLKQMAHYLAQGREFPKFLMDSYPENANVRYYNEQHTIFAPLLKIKKGYHFLLRVWKRSLAAIQRQKNPVLDNKIQKPF